MTSEKTILIVDDEASNCRLLTAYAKTLGYRTQLAASGAEALRMIGEQAPDVVLLDLIMPGLDGFQVIRKLKENPRTAQVPVIIVSALDDLAARQRVLACGADDFITKPVDRWELSLRLQKLLPDRLAPGIDGVAEQGEA